MSVRHYDVIVLGRSVGALIAAALLARRDFSVLVLGQGSQPATYWFGPHAMRRRSFSLLSASSPAFRRVLIDLAQSQTFRRRTLPLDPMLSVLMPDRRFELAPDLTLFEREMDREFPEIRRVIDELYTTLARVNQEADLAFGRDMVLPPGTFWERRKAQALSAELPFFRASEALDPLLDFPSFHPYRSVVLQSVAFATDLADTARALPPFAIARLHAAWTRGVVALAGGEDELVQFFSDRITAHGGTVALTERAERVVVQRDGVAGVLLEGDITRTGGRFLLSATTAEELAHLAQGEGVSARSKAEWPHVRASIGRFVVSLVVRAAGIPEPLGAEALLFGQPPGLTPDPRRPVLRLQCLDCIRGEGEDKVQKEQALLVAEMLLSQRGTLALTEAREVVFNMLRQYLPWLERHLVVVDSPHDGLPVWTYENGKRREVDRIHLKGASVRPEPMEWQYEIAPTSFFGLAGEPLRGPLERTVLIGKTVLPALGQEGELLAAWSAARLVTKSDPRREKLRLEMWNKAEIG